MRGKSMQPKYKIGQLVHAHLSINGEKKKMLFVITNSQLRGRWFYAGQSLRPTLDYPQTYGNLDIEERPVIITQQYHNIPERDICPIKKWDKLSIITP